MSYVSGIITAAATYYFPYDESHMWRLKSGYASPRQMWVIPANTAADIMADLAATDTALDAECTLFIGEIDAPLMIERVIVLSTGPADNYQRRILTFADVRYYFELQVFAVDLNQRRRVGDVTLVGDSLVSVTPDPTVAYSKWSLTTADPGPPADLEPYDWLSAKTETLDYLTSERHGRPAVDYATDTFHVIDPPAKLVMDTTTDSDGATGLGRIIQTIPGAGVYVDVTGTVRVFERTYGAEIPVIEALPEPLMDFGDLELCDESRRRPKEKYRIYFDFEVEVRFDFDPGGTFDVNDPYMENVLRVTDASLLIPAGGWGDARTVGEGSWITFDEAYAAWAYDRAHGGQALPSGYPDVSDEVIRTHWFDGGLTSFWMGDDLVTFTPVVAARIREVVRAYRTCFRVNPAFWDRVRHAWPVRASVWDPRSGTRSPAPVYSNYSTEDISPPIAASVREITTNYESSYPDSGLLFDGYPSGFHVQIKDEELGILEIERPLDRLAQWATAINPSPVETPAAITNDGVLFNEIPNQVLVEEWKLALVMSCAVGGPNDLRRFYEYQGTGAAAAASIGLDTSLAIGAGPDVELRTQLTAARVPWLDADRDDILSIFAVSDNPGITTAESLSDIDPINTAQELVPVGDSVAAADLLTKLDHYEGTRTVHAMDLINDDGTTQGPIGSIDEIVFRVQHNRFTATMHCTPIAPQFHAEDFLKGSARAFVLQELQQAGR